MKYPPVQYHDYLGLDPLLGSQKMRSAELGKQAHDEMLFIIVHQTYELWFKQILFEIDSVLSLFSKELIKETQMGTAVQRLERVVEIQRFILGQIDILETMTPLDFLDFRDYLYPASGFQSFQWRLIETKLGLKPENRLAYQEEPFYKQLKTDQQEVMKSVISSPSLFELVEKWLERTPFVQTETFDFWQNYQSAVENLFNEDKKVISENERLSPADKERNLKMIDGSLMTFRSLFSDEKFELLRKDGYFRLSAKAIRAALMIQIYRDQPALQMPFRLLKSLQDLDENMTQWRYRHALMAHRMLGKKIGTGGSSGHEYLKNATDKHKIFSDFFNLTTFLIPRSQVPSLPADLKMKMNYGFIQP